MTSQATRARGPDGIDVIDLGDGRAGRGFVDAGYGPVVADRRTRRAWNRDTAAVMFSCSKGVLAVCVPRLVEEMGGYGDARARQLTLALGRVVGA